MTEVRGKMDDRFAWKRDEESLRLLSVGVVGMSSRKIVTAFTFLTTTKGNVRTATMQIK
jgi:hypothetical protein